MSDRREMFAEGLGNFGLALGRQLMKNAEQNRLAQLAQTGDLSSAIQQGVPIETALAIAKIQQAMVEKQAAEQKLRNQQDLRKRYYQQLDDTSPAENIKTNAGKLEKKEGGDNIQSISSKTRISIKNGKFVEEIIPPEETEEGKLYFEKRKKEQEYDTKEAQWDRASTIRKEFNIDKSKQEYDLVSRGFDALESAYKMSINPDQASKIASDQALGVLFQKLLDPNSVVRESEYARTPEGAGFINRMVSILPQLQKGGLKLTDSDRKAIYDQARMLLESTASKYNTTIGRFTNLSELAEVNPQMVLGGLTKIKIPEAQEIPTFTTEEEALASGQKGIVIINGRKARID